ncbi:glycerate kinase, partial [Mycobacterium sp. NAZ190054]|uniref:glycerate kinase n=1 Tax=Mycobacterium sp. NAZ190054 TaxID=1747766 RepID=UPI0018D2380A
MVTTILIAPDSFGDSLTAVQAARCIAEGWRRTRPQDELTLAPQSDGGPGFVDVLAGRLGEVRTATVAGPLDTDVEAQWVFDAAARRRDRAAGLPHIRPADADHREVRGRRRDHRHRRVEAGTA